MKVAIVHYWLVGMRGGENVIEQLCKFYPAADIFTHVVDIDAISTEIKRHNIVETSIGSLPLAKKFYQSYLPLMPRALEQLDLQSYDLVISSESGPAKGIIPAPEAVHICYTHSPMRYIWDEEHQYLANAGFVKKHAARLFSHYLRMWDVSAAHRVDKFVANSSFIAARIKKFYRRDAEVLCPPVNLARFTPTQGAKPYFLIAGQLVRYKRADLAVRAMEGLPFELIVAGDGAERGRLEAMAPPNVTFLGRVSNEKLTELYQNCRVLLFPGREDFGIVPLEAMACGRPIIAYGRGGALDSMVPDKTAVFFQEQTVQALRAAIDHFLAQEARFDPSVIRAHAETFSEERFRDRFKEIVDQAFAAQGLRPTSGSR